MTPTQKTRARAKIAADCKAARANEVRIHYSQARPFHFVDEIGIGWHTFDCSGFIVNVFWGVMDDLRLWLADPSGQRFSGFGNTWSMEQWLREHGKRITTQGFLVGDIVMYDGHTAICHSKGTASTSNWTSHGSERGPVAVKLHYRDDVVGVWRHPALL